jgi:hypothetical protein
MARAAETMSQNEPEITDRDSYLRALDEQVRIGNEVETEGRPVRRPSAILRLFFTSGK